MAWLIGLIVMGIPWMMMEFGMGRFHDMGHTGSNSGAQLCVPGNQDQTT